MLEIAQLDKEILNNNSFIFIDLLPVVIILNDC